MCRINNVHKQSQKGWIALDIDGTVTDQLHEMPREVAVYLKKIALEGWQVMFITGRTFSFAHSILQPLDFPYYAALQNGADILKMPERTLVSRCYFPSAILKVLEEAYAGFEEDFIVYAGYAHQDFCYYRPDRFSPPFLEYLRQLKSFTPREWKKVNSFDEIDQEAFPLIKCFGKEAPMRALNEKLQKIPEVHATLIHDTVSTDLYLILVTAPGATKGYAVDRIVACKDGEGPVIVAGNDFNDLTMFHRADIRIVIETAPQELLDTADIIAPSAARCGIIEALEKAILLPLERPHKQNDSKQKISNKRTKIILD